MTRRYLHHYLRKPSLLAIALVQPVLFVLLWTYVFCGAIQTPGGITYVDYLMPGLFILAIAFGSANTGVGLADDLARGLIDRFRALPMARPALLVGRTLADTARNTFVVLLMVAVGYAVGFRFHAGPAAALAALAIPLAVGYLLSWISALIGLTVRDPETAGTASLLPVIPLAFTSSTFVPVATMPGWLQTWANTNPITHAVDATRALALGGPTSGPLLQGHRLDPGHPRRRHPPGHPPLPPRHPIAPWEFSAKEPPAMFAVATASWTARWMPTPRGGRHRVRSVTDTQQAGSVPAAEPVNAHAQETDIVPGVQFLDPVGQHRNSSTTFYRSTSSPAASPTANFHYPPSLMQMTTWPRPGRENYQALHLVGGKAGNHSTSRQPGCLHGPPVRRRHRSTRPAARQSPRSSRSFRCW